MESYDASSAVQTVFDWIEAQRSSPNLSRFVGIIHIQLRIRNDELGLVAQFPNVLSCG